MNTEDIRGERTGRRIRGWCRSYRDAWNNGKGMWCDDSPRTGPQGPLARQQQPGTLEECRVHTYIRALTAPVDPHPTPPRTHAQNHTNTHTLTPHPPFLCRPTGVGCCCWLLAAYGRSAPSASPSFPLSCCQGNADDMTSSERSLEKTISAHPRPYEIIPFNLPLSPQYPPCHRLSPSTSITSACLCSCGCSSCISIY